MMKSNLVEHLLEVHDVGKQQAIKIEYDSNSDSSSMIMKYWCNSNNMIVVTKCDYSLMIICRNYHPLVA